jgi:Winged helix domain, variant
MARVTSPVFGDVLSMAPTFSGHQGDARRGSLLQLQKLDVLLKAAVARARVLFAADESEGAFHGLYISENEIDSLMKRENGETLGSDVSVADALTDFLSSALIDAVGKRWAFTDFDNGVLVLALAPELNLRYKRIYAYLQDDVTKRRPTVDLALTLLCDNPEARIERRTRFAPGAPLIRSGMLRLLTDPSLVEPPLLAQYLRLDERAIRALLGDTGLDSRLASFCEWGSLPATPIDLGDQSEIVRRLPAFATAARNAGWPVRLLLSGDRQQAASHAGIGGGKREHAADG